MPERSVLIPLISGLGFEQPDKVLLEVRRRLNPFDIRAWVRTTNVLLGREKGKPS